MKIVKHIQKVNFDRIVNPPDWLQMSIGDCDSASMFVDSGAHSLYNRHVLKQHGTRIGTHGRELERPNKIVSCSDYSWYDLKPGSELRQYLALYAKLIRKCPTGTETLFVTVDAIRNPKKSFEIHRFFYQEYGIWTIPVIHFGASLKDADRYLEQKPCDFLGIGSGSRLTSFRTYVAWADIIFRHLCPASNKFLPTVRTHGFAMTDFKLMVRYPWWSVDSATWVKLGAYGWMLVPHWKAGGWRFDIQPLLINVSRRDGKLSRLRMTHRRHVKAAAGHRRGRHIDSSAPASFETVERWLKALGIPLGKYDRAGNITEIGAVSDGTVRGLANLCYYKIFEETLPTWPFPLDKKIREASGVNSWKGFGL